MRKTLAVLAFGATLLINPSIAQSNENTLSKKLCEALRPFTNEKGLVNDAYLIGEKVFNDPLSGKTYKVKGYILDGVMFNQLHGLDSTKEGRVKESYDDNDFNLYPILFGFPSNSDTEIMFFDAYQDGCSGEEVLVRNSMDVYQGRLKQLKI